MTNKDEGGRVEPVGCITNNKFNSKSKIYKFDPNIFNIIKKETAYWIGFLYGDGYFNRERLQLAVSIKDIDVIRKFLNFIKNPNRPIRHFECNGYPQCEIRIRSWQIRKNIEKYQLHIKKKDRGRLHIQLLQKEFRIDFLRGLHDADGCFTVDKRGYLFSEITGYKPILLDIKNILVDENIINFNKKIVKNGKNVFRIRLNARETLNFGYLIYNNYPNITCLDRKYYIFKTHVKRLNETKKQNILHI